jgi:hypothetical protein
VVTSEKKNLVSVDTLITGLVTILPQHIAEQLHVQGKHQQSRSSTYMGLSSGVLLEDAPSKS